MESADERAPEAALLEEEASLVQKTQEAPG